MGEDKKTQLGTTPGRTARPTGNQAATAIAAVGTPAPTTDPSKMVTSYLPDVPDPLLGATIADRYRIVRKLGEGGMGAVYLAMHMVLEKQVALKMLHGEFARKPDLVERFMQEAKAASRIRHENVIDISDFGATPDGLVFFAMELLKGHDLHEEIARAKLGGHLLPWSRTKKIFLQICSALSAAHARGIVHRDLKPENVYLVEFLGDPDFVKLLDFGIAKLTDVSGDENGRKLTKTGMLFGTPEYMSPEQARGEQVDHRVDIYAMGCILFQLCTNSVPFQADNFMGVLSQHLTAEAPQIAPETFDQIGAPRALGDVIDRALAKNRDERWQTIDDFAAAIREVCGDPAPADKSQPMRAPNVASVGATTRARTPTSADPPARKREPTGRVKTQWTGNLKVPEIAVPDDAPRTDKKKSSLPLILGGVALVAAGVAVAVVMMGNKRETPPPPPVVEQPPAPQPTPTPTPPQPQPPAEPPLPALVEIVLDSKPRGAYVTDLATGAKAKTPYTATIPGSKTPRQFKFELKGYGDSTVELVPNVPQIKFSQTLVKGATKSNSQVTKVPDPTTTTTGGGAVTKPDTTPVTKPDTTPTTKPDDTKPDIKPPDPKPEPKKDDCPDDEQPCLKVNIPGMSK